MSDPMDLMGMLQGANNPLGGILGGIGSFGMNLFNMLQQSAQNALTRQREDTAVQRRAKDMLAAGFNPVLAAGNPAASQGMPAIQMTQDPVAKAAEAMMRQQQIDNAATQKQLTQLQMKKAGIEIEADRYNLDWYKEKKIPTNFGMDQTTRLPLMMGSEIGSALNWFIEKAQQFFGKK